MKITEWYSGNQKPVRIGIYERDYPDAGVYYSWWNGLVFGFGAKGKKEAKFEFDRHEASPVQHIPWRGVAK